MINLRIYLRSRNVSLDTNFISGITKKSEETSAENGLTNL